jgi:hypothetical protein
LEYKASSLECLSVKPLGVEVYKAYTVKANLDLLGHFISANGRWDYAWAEVRKRVFRALFAKFRSCHISMLSLNGVAVEVQRHVWPVIRYRSNCWPFRIDVAKKTDSLQSTYISIAVAIAQEAGESLEEFHRRRAKSAGVAAASVGRWSISWARQVCDWNNHCERNSSGHLWASALIQVQSESWLRDLRRKYVPAVSAATNAFTELAGRLGTRARRGGPARRWHEAVADAQVYAEQHRLTSLLLKKGAKADQKFHAIRVSSLSGTALVRFEKLEGAESELEAEAIALEVEAISSVSLPIRIA